MRLEERIDPFLEKVNVDALIVNWFPSLAESVRNIIVNRIGENKKYIKESWHESPDLRFSQVLVNDGYIPNMPGMWYYEEEYETLIEQGHKAADVIFWGQNFDKNMKRLPKTKWRPISSMTTDHIQAVLDGKFTKSSTYLKAFNDELTRRKK